MRTNPWRRIALGALFSTALLFAAGSAQAGIGVGDTAPDFEGKTFFNTDDVSLRDLRGRVVFFELFSTT
ncbi:MAG: hypothetical protein ACYTG6_02570 [Planctomycetota bacterium]|jgi:hypothetical protein